MANDSLVSRLVLIRHGDRSDYADPHWKQTALEIGANVRDPPLSALGLLQARETAAEVKRLAADWDEGVHEVLASPYLRVVQTAQPTAHALNLPIHVEDGLAETSHVIDTIPSPANRWAVFPEIQVGYETRHIVTADVFPSESSPKTTTMESYPLGYFRRMHQVANTFENKLEGKNVVCFAHAASTALIASLAKVDLFSLKFAPCGIYVLEKRNGEWKMLQTGDNNSPYVSENNPGTYPWGFVREKAGQLWEKSLEELTM